MLCTSTGGVGHVHALSPVARALRERGHDVQWAVAPDGGVAVGAMGFEWAPAGLTTAARREAGAGELPAILQLPMAERRGPLFANYFARVAAPAMRRDLAPILDRVRPDIVVREAGELAAAPMAAARGIPLVTVAFSGVIPERARGHVIDGLRPVWHDEGLGEPTWDDVHGQLYLHPFPPSFGQRPDSSVVRPVRPDRGVPSTAPDPWVLRLGIGRPFVYVTAGTEPSSTSFPWQPAPRRVARSRHRRGRHHRLARRPGLPGRRTGQRPCRALRPAGRSARARQCGRLARWRRNSARSGVTRTTATGRADVRGSVGERRRRRERGLRDRPRSRPSRRRRARAIAACRARRPGDQRSGWSASPPRSRSMPPAADLAAEIEALATV